MTTPTDVRPSLAASQVISDGVLALVLTALAIWVQIAASTGVPGNRAPDALAVLLTVMTVAPTVLRRVLPLTVLVVSLSGLVLLMLGQYAVGAASPACLIAFYTCMARGTRREGRLAVSALLTAIVAMALLRPLDVSVEGTVVHLAAFFGGWLLGVGVRERRELESAREEAAGTAIEIARQQAELAHERASRATAEERLRITRELHDVVGHALSVVVVQADAAQQLLDVDPGAVRRALADIARTGRSSLADIRQVLGQLRESELLPAPVLSPLLGDLPELVARVQAAGLPIRLRLGGDLQALMPGVELATYRVVQEALTNCLKHASATTAWVSVERHGDEVQIEVRDDGIGPASAVMGNGLTGMHERVSVYGGQLAIGPADGGGFLVSAHIPAVAATGVGAT